MSRGQSDATCKRLLPAWVVFFSFLAITSCPAVSPWALRAWQTEKGLPEVNVTGVAQTPKGYLWIATHGGLARFDGVRFQLQ